MAATVRSGNASWPPPYASMFMGSGKPSMNPAGFWGSGFFTAPNRVLTCGAGVAERRGGEAAVVCEVERGSGTSGAADEAVALSRSTSGGRCAVPPRGLRRERCRCSAGTAATASNDPLCSHGVSRLAYGGSFHVGDIPAGTHDALCTEFHRRVEMRRRGAGPSVAALFFCDAPPPPPAPTARCGRRYGHAGSTDRVHDGRAMTKGGVRKPLRSPAANRRPRALPSSSTD